MHRLVLLIALLCTASPAWTGAWLRETGRSFRALTGILRQGDPDARYEFSLYQDYGIAPRLTLGLDLNERPGITGHVLIFARLPLSRPGARSKLAVEAALGGHHWRGAWDPMYRVTLSFGRGFLLGRRGAGWFAIDAGYERRLGNAQPTYKLDATLGLSAPGRVHPILQLESAKTPGQRFAWAVAPGLLIDRRDHGAWLIALERKSAGRDTIGLKFGLWQRF